MTVWSAAHGTYVRELEAGGECFGVATAGDVVAAGLSGTQERPIRLWQLSTGKPLGSLRVPGHPFGLAMRGDLLFSTSRDEQKELWLALRTDFSIPSFLADLSRDPVLSVGAMAGVGQSLHAHDASWLAQVRGRKLWIHLPPESIPRNVFHRVSAGKLMRENGAVRCLVEVGEVLVQPANWWHATYLLGDSKAAGAAAASENAPHDQKWHPLETRSLCRGCRSL